MTLIATNVRPARRAAATSGHAISLMTYLSVWKQRRELAAMSDTRLKDLGISPADAAREVARPFWDVPHNARG